MQCGSVQRHYSGHINVHCAEVDSWMPETPRHESFKSLTPRYVPEWSGSLYANQGRLYIIIYIYICPQYLVPEDF